MPEETAIPPLPPTGQDDPAASAGLEATRAQPSASPPPPSPADQATLVEQPRPEQPSSEQSAHAPSDPQDTGPPQPNPLSFGEYPTAPVAPGGGTPGWGAPRDDTPGWGAPSGGTTGWGAPSGGTPGWGAPVPAPPPRRRRRVWPFALTGVVVFGLVAGLLVWAPWDTPPPGAPAAVVAASRTATSVVVSWASSKGGTTPDHYLILRDGKQVGSVAASQTSFTDDGLAPGTTHHYTIIATAGQQRSADSVATRVTTITPGPVDLAGVKATWTTATFRWSPSPLGPAPTAYEIDSDGSSVATVSGTTNSYSLTGLAPGHSYQYQVIAHWGNTASDPSSTVTVSTLAPPLNGSVPVNLNTVSTPGAGASLKVGDHWSDDWLFAPHCTAAGCSMTANADLAAPGFEVKEFAVALHGSGGKYSGTTNAQISACSTAKDTNTVTLTVNQKGAVTNGAWSTWSGTMQVSAPYTTVGDEFCPAQSWTFAVSGTNS